jgi:adenylate cyclase
MPINHNKLSQFWQELKRRKVTRTITVYAAAAFVTLELVSIIVEPLKLPEWTLPFIIVMLCVGFIIAIILSWIFDKHPAGGIVKTESAKKVTEEPASPSTNGWKIASYISFVVIIGLIVLNIFGKQSKVRIDESLAKSIAVLPFHNLSGDDEQEYICVGLTDEIISHLFKVRSFDEVRSLTSILPFKDSEQSIKEIAQQLQVNYVLEGTYKRMGDELKITAQLIEPGSDNHIWLQDYELPYSEIPGIPGEIALQIANHLKTFISEDEQKRVKRISTTNQEAYELFQHVNYYFIRRDFSSLSVEETLFKVIELDPEYADSYAFMGFVALLGVGYASDTSSTSQLTVYDALPYVNKALELDPDNAVACMVLGLYNLWVKWDYPEAEKNFLKATNLEPNNTFNKISLATLYLTMERMEELESLIPAIEEESEIAMAYYAKLKNHKAFQESRGKYYEFAGELALPPIGEYYIWLGEYDSARYVCEKGLKLGITEMSTPRFKSSQALAYHKTGDSMKAREIINELISDSEQSLPGSIEYFIGLYYSGTGDADSAFYWLEKAYNRHSAEMYWLRVNPVLDNIRDDPRYWDLYERTGHKTYDDYMASKNN